MNEDSKYYWEGYKSYEKDDTTEVECPYYKNPERSEWYEGYFDAEIDFNPERFPYVLPEKNRN